jgi:hypothetical protein
MNRFSSRLLASITCIVVLGMSHSSAKAYTVLYDSWGYHRTWLKSTVKWYVASNGSDDVSPDQIEDAIGAAFDAWKAVSCSDLNFLFGGVKSFNPNKDIFIRWLETNWNMTVQDAMGVTTNWKMNGPGQGIDKVEIFFNGQHFEWTTSGADDPFSNKVDVQAVATHEIGHAIGLNHTRERFATMFFTSSPGKSEEAQILHDDDKRGICFLYPAIPFTQGQVCDACKEKSNCTTGVCFSYGDEGAFCGQDCGANSPCPDGYGCFNVPGVSTSQCIPNNEHCAPTGGNIAIGDYCYDHDTCSSNRCLVLPDSAVCSKECNPLAGGNAGCPSSMKCIGKDADGICYPKGDQGLGEPCESPADCESFECIGIGDGEGVCTQTCTNDSQCPGTMSCMGEKCVQLGSGKHGDACTKITDCANGLCVPFLGYCSELCDTNEDCPYEGNCLLAGVCDAGAQGKTGDACGDGAKTCMSGLTCLYLAKGDTTGICRVKCDVRYDACEQGAFCEWIWQPWLNKVVGACTENNGGKTQGDDCGGPAYCLPDLVCADTDGTGPKCRQDCKATNFLGCSNGATCIALNLSDDPMKGACHPKDAPPPIDDPQVVETTTDAGPIAPDAGNTVPDGRSTADGSATIPPSPSSGGSSGGGCQVTFQATPTGVGWILFVVVLLGLAYRKRSMMITSS